MRYIRIFSELSGQIRNATQKRVVVEIALIKLMKPAMENDYEALINRISVLEKQLESGVVAVPAVKEEIEEAPAEDISELPMAVPEDVQAAVNAIPQIMNKMSSYMRILLEKCRCQAAGESTLLLVSDNSVAIDCFSEPKKREQLENIISGFIGKKITVNVKSITDSEMRRGSFIKPQAVINMDIEEIIEDEDL